MPRPHSSHDSTAHNENDDDDDDETAPLVGALKSDNARKESRWHRTLAALPPASFFLLFTEFAERACYFGVAATLVLYMQQMLSFAASTTSAVSSAFTFAAYGFVLLGGWAADRGLGAAPTVAAFGAAYLVGLALLSASASPAAFAAFPYGPTWAVAGLGAGLGLIALGTGGIKANVASLVGNQLRGVSAPQEVETAYRYYYLFINVGSTVGTLVVPLLQHVGPAVALSSSQASSACGNASSSEQEQGDSGYYASFTLCTALFACAFIVFLAGWPFYARTTATGKTSILTRAAAMAMRARENRLKRGAAFWSVPAGRDHWMWWACVDAAAAPGDDDAQFVADVTATLFAVRPFLATMPVYWVAYLTMGTVMVFQAELMYLPWGMAANQLMAADHVFIIVLVPVIDAVVLPTLRSATGLALTAVTRISAGFVLAALSMFAAAGVQVAVNGAACQGRVNALAQLPQYFLLAASEVLVGAGSLEYVYLHSAASMKSVAMSALLFTTAVAAAIQAAYSPALQQAVYVWVFVGLGCAVAAAGGVLVVAFGGRD